MGVTYTFSGSLIINAQGTVAYSGDQSGQQQVTFNPATINFSTSGGTAPTITGFVKGSANASTTPASILLAHATNILNVFSATAVYSDGFTVAGSKIKYLAIQNNDSTNNITVATPSSNSFPIIQATAQSLAILVPGGIFQYYNPAPGLPSGGLTTLTNDALAITASAGTPNFTIIALYGN